MPCAVPFYCLSLINELSNIRNRSNTAETNTIRIETMYTNRIGVPAGSEDSAFC